MISAVRAAWRLFGTALHEQAMVQKAQTHGRGRQREQYPEAGKQACGDDPFHPEERFHMEEA